MSAYQVNLLKSRRTHFSPTVDLPVMSESEKVRARVRVRNDPSHKAEILGSEAEVEPYTPVKVESFSSEELSSQPNGNIVVENEKGLSKDVNGAEHTNSEEIVYPSGIVLAAIILALCLAVFLVALDQTIIATAIPRITDRFQSVKDIGWYGAVRPYHFHLRLLLTFIVGLLFNIYLSTA